MAKVGVNGRRLSIEGRLGRRSLSLTGLSHASCCTDPSPLILDPNFGFGRRRP